MAFENVNVDPGASATVPVAVDNVAAAIYQRLKLADPAEGGTGAAGVDAAPIRVRPRRRGTADYDSGILAVASGAPQQITATTIYPEGGTLSNPHATEARVVTITNAANDELLTLTVQPQSSIPIPVPGGAWVGWKIGASGTGVRAQLSGAQ